MGLDWCLWSRRPRDGKVLEYRRLTRKLEALENDEAVSEVERKRLRTDLEAALEQVSVSAYEIIQAPRIGVDKEADDWFKTNVYERNRLAALEEEEKPPPADPLKPKLYSERDEEFIRKWSRPLHVLIAEEKGKYVSSLAKRTEGLGRIIGMMCSALDFRGQCIASATIFPEDLRNEAFDDHDPDAALDFAERLEEALTEFKNSTPDWKARTEKDDYGNTVAVKDEVEAVEAGIQWMRFWGNEGFGFSAWA